MDPTAGVLDDEDGAVTVNRRRHICRMQCARMSGHTHEPTTRAGRGLRTCCPLSECDTLFLEINSGDPPPRSPPRKGLAAAWGTTVVPPHVVVPRTLWQWPTENSLDLATRECHGVMAKPVRERSINAH